MTISNASSKRRQTRLIALVVVLALAAFCLRTFIRDQTVIYIVLHSESANSDVVEDLIQKRPDPAPFLWQLWRTRKVSQRQEVLAHLKTSSRADMPRGMLALLHAAALDPDANLRELALGILQEHKDPQLRDLARAQLLDADPQLRMLGIHYLHDTGDASLTPELIPLVADSDPSVVVTADSVLRRWTTNDFGLRLVSVVSDPNGEPKSLEASLKNDKIRAGAGKWRAWWEVNKASYSAVPPPQFTFPALDELPLAGDFALKDLSGRTIHLSDFKGKTVLLNFWTTWCTACQEEMPRLIELQKLHPELAIISISIDGVKLDDDDDSGIQVGSDDATTLRKKIERLVKSRGINYRILLDPEGKIGIRFNGNELPTNVFIDPEGRVRRRFIGTRSLAALEAMLKDVASNK